MFVLDRRGVKGWKKGLELNNREQTGLLLSTAVPFIAGSG